MPEAHTGANKRAVLSGALKCPECRRDLDEHLPPTDSAGTLYCMNCLTGTHGTVEVGFRTLERRKQGELAHNLNRAIMHSSSQQLVRC